MFPAKQPFVAEPSRRIAERRAIASFRQTNLAMVPLKDFVLGHAWYPMRSLLISFWLLTAFTPHGSVGDEAINFNRDIRPILSNNCFQCHGFDANTREANLRLDTIQGATAELDSGSGQAITPSQPELSVLLDRLLTQDDDERMPPAESGKQVTPQQIQLIRQWIEQGAKYEKHWSFNAPQESPTPSVQQTSWPRNTIDYFVLARLEAESLRPSPEADRRTLIRRVALDVTGLPPTREEVHRYLEDDSPDHYETMVDYYLASHRYGEHMARHWLDLARYADTSGYQYDRERTMWVWRDWVIHAYNSNMSFDQFTVEQIAGDLLPNATPQQVLATGFNRNHPITIEGGVIDEEYRTEYVIDRLTTTSTVWMGLTVGCARCHDHKFDPISQKDFYELADFFNQVAERGLNGFDPQQKIASPLADVPDSETLAKMQTIESELTQLSQSPSDDEFESWSNKVANSQHRGWETVKPIRMVSSGGSELTIQSDFSFVAGRANPQKDIYEVTAKTDETGLTAVRLECLTDPSLPGNGPGRHLNSNFVLSEFELVVTSTENPNISQAVKFTRAMADYSQANYEISKSIDGIVSGNNGWAVDGPTRKQSATAIFIAEQPFGFSGGTELQFRIRHEASFQTHGIGRPRLSITSDEPASVQIAGISREIRKIANKKPEARSIEESRQLNERFENERNLRAVDLKTELDSLSAAKTYPPTLVMRDLPKRRKTHVLLLGQYDRIGEEVTAGVPAAVMPMEDSLPANRLGFAKWLVDPDHPLTARVAVNRYWQQLFGRGLVKTSEDFGTQGQWPSHPELLDTLATQFVASGWDVKAMLRMMLTSSTYRQDSRVSKQLLEMDPENRLLARGPRFRLDAEQIRDQALAISGLLKEKLGGPSVYPYQPKGLWMELNNRPGYSREYVADRGDSLYRRSMYTFWKRTVLSPMLTTFDAPGREFCTVRRSRTNTPLQALLLLQGPQYVESARHLAARMMREGGRGLESRLKYGFEIATARLPEQQEIEILKSLYQERRRAFQENPAAARKALEVGESPLEPDLDPIELAAWMEIARLLLNLDEVITKG